MEEVEVGDRRFSSPWIADVHPLSVDGVTCDVVEDGLVFFFGRRLRDGEVEFGCGALGKLMDKVLQGHVRFCGDDAPRGVFVESVHNAGTSFATFACELSGTVVEEGIDECAIFISRSWMDDHAWVFVDDDEVLVFEKGGDLEVLSKEFSGFVLWDVDGDFIVFA